MTRNILVDVTRDAPIGVRDDATMLRVTRLEAGYGESQVLFGVDLEIGAGEVVTLLGRNGMGKTTTVSAIMGILPPRAGAIEFERQPIAGWPAWRIARAGLGLVPEGRHIFPNLSVRENLVATARGRSAGARADAHAVAHTGVRAQIPSWSLPAVLELFPVLADRLGRAGSLLSGGEQQMLAIGRALMTNPRLLILDEATEGLAPLIRHEIWRCLERLKAAGQAILVIDKNIDALMRIADRHYILEKGRIVWSGNSALLDAQRELRERYLGV